MKYIFDFDDTLFHTTRSLRERIYDIYAEKGITRLQIDKYLDNNRHRPFSLKKLLLHFSLTPDVYERMMTQIEEFINADVLDLVRRAGRENCFIVTMGDEEFQRDKIRRAGIEKYFQEIIVVWGTKKTAVESICEKFKDENVVFIDDKAKHLEDLDMKKYPNLKTILYTGQDVEPLLL